MTFSKGGGIHDGSLFFHGDPCSGWDQRSFRLTNLHQLFRLYLSQGPVCLHSGIVIRPS